MINLFGPGIDATGQINHISKVVVFQKTGNMKAAHAMMTNDHRFLTRVELTECCLDLTHRQQLRTCDVTTLELPRFTNIKQQRLRALRIIEPGFEFRRT